MDTVESLVAFANSKGLWMNNLYQRQSYPALSCVSPRLTGDWQANFRTPGGTVHEFGHGKTPVEAIKNALTKLPITKPAVIVREELKDAAPGDVVFTDPFS